MFIKVKKLHKDAIIPKYQTNGAACFDIHALIDEKDKRIMSWDGPSRLTPGVGSENNSSEVYRTGLSFEIPEGYVMMVYSRSGHGFKHDVRLANCVGVIDSDYRGELMVKITADAEHGMMVADGDRIAQAMIIPIQQVFFTKVEELSETSRGEKGFGSTGVVYNAN